MVLIAKGRNGEIDLRHAILLRLGFRVFDGPARVAVLLSELRGLVLPVLGNATITERLLLLLCVALLRRRDDCGIDNLAAHRQETRSPQKLVEARNKTSTAPARFSPSRNVQIVLASGTASATLMPRKRMNDSRSLIRYSQRSSDRECIACRIRTLNMRT